MVQRQSSDSHAPGSNVRKARRADTYSKLRCRMSGLGSMTWADAFPMERPSAQTASGARAGCGASRSAGGSCLVIAREGPLTGQLVGRSLCVRRHEVSRVVADDTSGDDAKLVVDPAPITR